MGSKKNSLPEKTDGDSNIEAQNLIIEIIDLIDSAKIQVANYTNAALVLLYWKIGSRINNNILKNNRAEYGEQFLIIIENAIKSKSYCKG